MELVIEAGRIGLAGAILAMTVGTGVGWTAETDSGMAKEKLFLMKAAEGQQVGITLGSVGGGACRAREGKTIWTAHDPRSPKGG